MNNILISLKLDQKITRIINPYVHLKLNDKKTIQEIAGYSERKEINEVLDVSKKELKEFVLLSCNENDKILDIGCGPGMYLSLLKDQNFELYGTDINNEMIKVAQQNVSNATFYHGDFNRLEINKKFNFIYCIGVLIYFTPSQLDGFFKKIYLLLEEGGILYLNFPHAISYFDTLFKDLSYVQYSPCYLRKILSKHFEILTDKHAFDGRKIDLYDKKPYKSLNPNTHRTYKNSYLLIVKKKL